MKTLVLLSLLLAVGCSAPTDPSDTWMPDYDTAWREVVACYGSEPDKPVVIVREDCRSKYAAQDFPVGQGWVHGWYHGGKVEVCPDLAALRHEFSHHVSLHVRGYEGHDGEGVCWL